MHYGIQSNGCNVWVFTPKRPIPTLVVSSCAWYPLASTRGQ